jgi:hypothetical protein
MGEAHKKLTDNKNDTAEKDTDDRKYIVKSVFVGEQDIKTAILRLAERKAMKEMGLDIAVQQ